MQQRAGLRPEVVSDDDDDATVNDASAGRHASPVQHTVLFRAGLPATARVQLTAGDGTRLAPSASSSAAAAAASSSSAVADGLAARAARRRQNRASERGTDRPGRASEVSSDDGDAFALDVDASPAAPAAAAAASADAATDVDGGDNDVYAGDAAESDDDDEAEAGIAIDILDDDDDADDGSDEDDAARQFVSDRRLPVPAAGDVDAGASSSSSSSSSAAGAAVQIAPSSHAVHPSLATFNTLLHSSSAVVDKLRRERDELQKAAEALRDANLELKNSIATMTSERDARISSLEAEIEKLEPLAALAEELEVNLALTYSFYAGEAPEILPEAKDDRLHQLRKNLQAVSAQVEAELTRRADAAKEANTCVVCLERQLTHFFDCGHRICEPCGTQILADKKQCHVCRGSITWVKKLY